MIVRSLQPGEEEACLDLWDIGFDDTSRSYFEKYFQDPTWQHDDTVVCVVDSRLVSVVHAVRRRVSSRVGTLGMAGIANVATHPDFQRRGYNTACLTELLRRLEADPALDFCLLGTDIHNYYARHGFERWDFAGREGTPVGAVHPASTDVHLRTATPEDLPALQQVYRLYNEGRPFTVQRPEAYWQTWLNLDFAQVLVAERSPHSVVGYLFHRIEEEVLLVEEIGALGNEPRVLEALLIEAVRQARPHGITRLRLLVPMDDGVQELANVLLEEATPYPIDWWMVRPLHGRPIPFSFEERRPFFWESDSF